MRYSKRHNKFLFPALAGAIYGSFCKAENEISNVVNYKSVAYGQVKEVQTWTGSGKFAHEPDCFNKIVSNAGEICNYILME